MPQKVSSDDFFLYVPFPFPVTVCALGILENKLQRRHFADYIHMDVQRQYMLKPVHYSIGMHEIHSVQVVVNPHYL